MIAQQDFEMMTGNTYDVVFTVVDDEGAAFTPDVADTLTWVMRAKAKSTGTVVLTKTNTHITWVNPGEIVVRIDPLDTTLMVAGAYYHELALSRNADEKETIAYGTITLLKSGVL